MVVGELVMLEERERGRLWRFKGELETAGLNGLVSIRVRNGRNMSIDTSTYTRGLPRTGSTWPFRWPLRAPPADDCQWSSMPAPRPTRQTGQGKEQPSSLWLWLESAKDSSKHSRTPVDFEAPRKTYAGPAKKRAFSTMHVCSLRADGRDAWRAARLCQDFEPPRRPSATLVKQSRASPYCHTTQPCLHSAQPLYPSSYLLRLYNTPPLTCFHLHNGTSLLLVDSSPLHQVGCPQQACHLLVSRRWQCRSRHGLHSSPNPQSFWRWPEAADPSDLPE